MLRQKTNAFGPIRSTAACVAVSKLRLRSPVSPLICPVLLSLLTLSPMLLGQDAQSCITPIPHPLTSLLRAPSVHKELAVNPDQIEAMALAAGEVDRPLWIMRDLPHRQRQENVQRLVTQLKTRLAALLSAQQLERLNQILWQAMGVDAILEPGMRARLDLSPEQTRNIVVFLDLGYQKLAELQRNRPLGTESTLSVKLQMLRAETQENIAAVLNPAQQQALPRLTGQRFDFSQVRTIACRAPELSADTWLNASPVRLAELRGNVVVVHFYAFGCVNCVRRLPHYNAWYKQFSRDGLRIIGIHRPETEQERNVDKVKEKAAAAGMMYPIAIDNEGMNWHAWGNNVWPGIYLIDREGFIRHWWYGELNWQGAQSEAFLRSKIRELLKEDPVHKRVAVKD